MVVRVSTLPLQERTLQEAVVEVEYTEVLPHQLEVLVVVEMVLCWGAQEALVPPILVVAAVVAALAATAVLA